MRIEPMRIHLSDAEKGDDLEKRSRLSKERNEQLRLRQRTFEKILEKKKGVRLVLDPEVTITCIVKDGRGYVNGKEWGDISRCAAYLAARTDFGAEMLLPRTGKKAKEREGERER